MIYLKRNKVVEMFQSVRKAKDKICSDQQGRPGLLFRADSVLLTDGRKEAKKAPEQAASILFIKHH